MIQEIEIHGFLFQILFSVDHYFCHWKRAMGLWLCFWVQFFFRPILKLMYQNVSHPFPRKINEYGFPALASFSTFFFSRPMFRYFWRIEFSNNIRIRFIMPTLILHSYYHNIQLRGLTFLTYILKLLSYVCLS